MADFQSITAITYGDGDSPFGSVADAACRILNESFAADPNAIHSLSVNRVPCNQALADHPSVVVDTPPTIGDSSSPLFQVGMIGVVNGILAVFGSQRLAIKFTDEQDGDGRSKIVGFCVVEDRPNE